MSNSRVKLPTCIAAVWSSQTNFFGAFTLLGCTRSRLHFVHWQLTLTLSIAIVALTGCASDSPDPNAPIPPGPYTVAKGDDLSSISVRAYGEIDLWFGLLNANLDLRSRPGFDLVIGETIAIPKKEDLDMSLPKSVFPKSLPGEYIVLPGDNLNFIAKGCYGDRDKWEVIYNANRDKLSARVKEKRDELIAGQVLTIPAIEATDVKD